MPHASAPAHAQPPLPWTPGGVLAALRAQGHTVALVDGAVRVMPKPSPAVQQRLTPIRPALVTLLAQESLCGHPVCYRRPSAVLVCLHCGAAQHPGGLWTPQAFQPCATHTAAPAGPQDGPVRQCPACPSLWELPCPTCRLTSWYRCLIDDAMTWLCAGCLQAWEPPVVPWSPDAPPTAPCAVCGATARFWDAAALVWRCTACIGEE